jgi:predicted GIY-YIG superfamily endonuclease
MTSRPRTIQIFLPSGDPSGIRVAEITTSIIRLVEVPRALLSSFLAMPEASQVGTYYLIGGDDSRTLYIGQSGEIGKRLQQHGKDETKEWERALVLVSMTNNLTQTHVLYLESLSIERAKICQRYSLTNSNNGQRPFTPVPMQADCEEIHEIGSILLATLGYPIFEPLLSPDESNPQDKFFCKRSGVLAEGFYTHEGFVVLAGSRGRLTQSGKPSEAADKIRKQLLDTGVLAEDGAHVVVTKDTLFKTPSAASCALLMAASNGWNEWKNQAGQSLSDVYRSD